MKKLQKSAAISFVLLLIFACNASKRAKITEVKKKEDAQKMEQLEKNKAQFQQEHKNDLGK